MTPTLTTHRLTANGGELYYEVRGSGPLLLVIGQPMTAAPFGPLADLLANEFTVVTYDPHGLGQSTVADPSLPVTPEVEADDLAHIIDAVGGGPADVFGSSGGAVAGLALAVRHPAKVRTLIAHEPPVVALLPDAEHVRAVSADVEESFRKAGSGAGWGKFVSLVMHQGPVTANGVQPATWSPPGAADASADQAPPAPSEKQLADDAMFFLRMLNPFARYEPDADLLRSGSPRVVLAVGESSGAEIAKRSTLALADQLGQTPTTFPGDHGGFMADPAAFADAIRQVLKRD